VRKKNSIGDRQSSGVKGEDHRNLPFRAKREVSEKTGNLEEEKIAVAKKGFERK